VASYSISTSCLLMNTGIVASSNRQHCSLLRYSNTSFLSATACRWARVTSFTKSTMVEYCFFSRSSCCRWNSVIPEPAAMSWARSTSDITVGFGKRSHSFPDKCARTIKVSAFSFSNAAMWAVFISMHSFARSANWRFCCSNDHRKVNESCPQPLFSITFSASPSEYE